MLFSNHITSLGARAISVAAAEACGIRSATPPEVASILGLPTINSGGILIPYIGADGLPMIGDDGQECVRVRMDEGTPKYQSRAGSGYSIFLSPMIRAEIARCVATDTQMIAADFVLITEGEFKALSVETNLGIPSLGIPGVTMFRDPGRDKSEPATNATPLHPELAGVIARTKGVVVVADSDAAENHMVRSAMTALRDCISHQFGIPAAYFEVPGSKKKAGRPKSEESAKAEKIGIDDWIAKVGATGYDSIIASLRKVFYAERDRLQAMADGGCLPLGIKIDQQTGAVTNVIFSTKKQSVMQIKAADLTNPAILIGAAGGEYLMATYPKKDKSGTVVGFDNLQAAIDIDARCTEVGFWDDSRKVGAGVWPAPGDRFALVVNSCTGVWSSRGTEINRVDTATGQIYMTDQNLGVTATDEQATAAQVSEILKAMQSFTWLDPRDADMALAWTAAACLCGGLPHRPMLAVSGKTGSGKSAVLNFIRRLLGNLALPKYDATVITEAGLRITLGSSSRVSILDEAEGTKKDPDRMDQIMEYVRSSYEGGVGPKGKQTGGGSETFVMRTMAALAAVDLPHMDDTEKNRFIRLHMHPRQGNVASHPMAKSDPAMAGEYGALLSSRMLHSFARFRRALDVVQPLLGDVSQRCIDTIGTVVAAGFVATSDAEPTAAVLLEYMNTLDIDSQRDRITDDIDANPLEWLLDRVFTVDVSGRINRLSVREICIQAFKEYGTRLQPFGQTLGRMGLRLSPDKDGHPALYMDPSNEELASMFASSKWAGQALADLFKTHVPTCGKKLAAMTMSIGGKKVRPLEISQIDKIIDFAPEVEVVYRPRTAADSICEVYEMSGSPD